MRLSFIVVLLLWDLPFVFQLLCVLVRLPEGNVTLGVRQRRGQVVLRIVNLLEGCQIYHRVPTPLHP